MSNVKKINIPLEDSNCGDIDEESGEDDETFSSSKKNQIIESIRNDILHTRYYFISGFRFITKKLTGTIFK